jgi:hypothetical protein
MKIGEEIDAGIGILVATRSQFLELAAIRASKNGETRLFGGGYRR